MNITWFFIYSTTKTKTKILHCEACSDVAFFCESRDPNSYLFVIGGKDGDDIMGSQ